MTAIEHCARCGRAIDTEQAGVDDWESTQLDSGVVGVICAGCMTAEDRQAMDEDAWALDDALDAAGLLDGADPEAMSKDEYEMREQLAQMLYEHERPDGVG